MLLGVGQHRDVHAALSGRNWRITSFHRTALAKYKRTDRNGPVLAGERHVTLTVFIAEDNSTALASLAELLVASCEVEVVGAAQSELEVADWLLSSSDPCDLIVTDLLLLPGGSGFGVIQHAKSLRASTKVVAFSDFVTPAVARRCAALGADAVFNKSELDQFLDYVRSLRTDFAGAVG